MLPVVMLTPAFTVIENDLVAERFEIESNTCAVNTVVPVAPVGLPVIAPAVERLRPAGSDEPPAMDHV